MTSLVLLVAAVLSGVSFWQLLEHVLRETNKRTVELAGDSFEWVQRALADASSHGWRPESNSAGDIHDYVRYALQSSEGLQAQLKAAIGSPAIYEVTIIDQDGIVLVSSDKSEEGKFHLRRSAISELMQRSFLHKVTVLRGKPRIYEYSLPFKAGGQPFDIRVAISTGLLLDEMATGPYFGGTIRRAFAGGYRFRRKRGRTGTREPENYAGRPAIARSTRNLQHHARKHEFRDGRARGWIAAVHAGCARGDDQPGGGKISR